MKKSYILQIPCTLLVIFSSKLIFLETNVSIKWFVTPYILMGRIKNFQSWKYYYINNYILIINNKKEEYKSLLVHKNNKTECLLYEIPALMYTRQYNKVS